MTLLQVLKAVSTVISLLRQAGVMSTIQSGIVMMLNADTSSETKHATVRNMVVEVLAKLGKEYKDTIIDTAIKLVYAVIAKKL